MNTATLVRHLDDWDAEASLYRLDPPLRVNGDAHTQVIVSTKHDDGTSGSVVLAASAGVVLSWSPLARTDSTSHADALALIGYQVSA